MQVLVQSYRRLKYLKQTVESLRKDDVELFIVDGGSDEETTGYIASVADKYLLYKDNPGADFLKNEGIRHLVTDPYFILSADDVEYPEHYSNILQQQFDKLNKKALKWVFCSCNMLNVENNMEIKHQWKTIDGMELMQVGGPQSAAAIVSRTALLQVELFSEFGKYGAGDWALGKKLSHAGYFCCYLRAPMVIHLGTENIKDFPDFQKAGDADINENYYKAIKWK